MAIAGRVAIVPKGEYSNAVTYDKLDLVMFNNDAYVAKKASTGIEPTDDEYWMLILNNVVAEDLENIINGTTPVGNANQLGGKDASEYALDADLANYAVLGENNYSGALKIATDKETLVGFIAKNALREVRLYANNTGKIQLYDATNGKAIIASETDGTTTFNGTASGNVPKTGSTTITGDNNMPIRLKSKASNNVYQGFETYSGSFVGALGFNASGKPSFLNSAQSTESEILHSGNVGDYALPLSGSKDMTGNRLGLYKGYGFLYTDESSTAVIASDGTPNNDNATVIRIENPSIYEASLANAIKLRYKVNGTTNEYNVLHTGNKPTGTYTGNGSATSRTISTGGIGSALAIWGNSCFALVTSGGAFIKNTSNQLNIATLHDLRFENGILTIVTSSDAINKNGVTYYYQVL